MLQYNNIVEAHYTYRVVTVAVVLAEVKKSVENIMSAICKPGLSRNTGKDRIIPLHG
jgi:hypothetical protein